MLKDNQASEQNSLVRLSTTRRTLFTVATVAGIPAREQILQPAQQDWQKMGIAMQIRTMPSALPMCNPAPVEGTKAKLAGFHANDQSHCWNIRRWHWDA